MKRERKSIHSPARGAGIFVLLLGFCFLFLGAAASGEEALRTVTFWNTEIRSDQTEVTFEDTDWLVPSELDQLLEQMPQLTKVNMFNKRVKLSDILGIYEKHPDVEFGLTIQMNRSHTVRTDMTAYSTLGRQPQISKAQTRYFTCMKHLKALDIGHMNIYSADFLKDCPKLKILIIADCALRDIDALSSQTELEYLEVFKNYISDLTPLSGMTKLKDLNLGYCEITDLSPIYDLPSLERVWLMGNWYLSEEEIQRFREHQPNCEIVTRSYGATGNLMDENMVQTPGTSWRHHPHYDTIYWIFHHNEYIGWDVEVPQVKTAADP